jgi:hypothetical protein
MPCRRALPVLGLAALLLAAAFAGGRARAAGGLLTGDDLPPGWQSAEVPDAPTAPRTLSAAVASLALCTGGADSQGAGIPLAGRARFALTRGQLADTIDEVVATAEPGEGATAMMDLRALLTGCAERGGGAGDQTGPSGAPLIYGMVLSLTAGAGDDAIAAHITLDGDFTNVAADLVLALRGDTVVVVAYRAESFAAPVLEGGLALRLARRALERLGAESGE